MFGWNKVLGHVGAFVGPFWPILGFCWPFLVVLIYSNQKIFGWNRILGHVGGLCWVILEF